MMHGGAWEHEHQQQQQQEPEEEEEEEEEEEDQVNHHNRNTNMVGVGMGMGMGMGMGVGVGVGVGVGGYVKVMTDDQLETLRKQISAYATICDRLVQMHKSLTSHPDHLPGGVRLGNLYCDPLLTSGGHKITARQRWTPTPVQLQILERIFDQGNGTPTKQKIKEITSQLGQHGHISETNVYNWFQNRRARSKRKHQNTTPPPAESELDTEVEIEVEVDSQSLSQSQSPKDKKTRPHHHHHHHHASAPQDIGFQGPEILHFFDPHTSKAEPMFQSNAPLRPSRNLPQMPFYDGNEQLGGKMEVSRGYSLYEAAAAAAAAAAAEEEEEDYNMT